MSFWYEKWRSSVRLAQAKARTHRAEDELSGINNGFIDQQNGDVVANWIDTPALRALQALSVFFERQPLLAYRTHENVKEILRNHASIVRLRKGRRFSMHGIGADACHARVRESVVRRRKATLT